MTDTVHIRVARCTPLRAEPSGNINDGTCAIIVRGPSPSVPLDPASGTIRPRHLFRPPGGVELMQQAMAAEPGFALGRCLSPEVSAGWDAMDRRFVLHTTQGASVPGGECGVQERRLGGIGNPSVFSEVFGRVVRTGHVKMN